MKKIIYITFSALLFSCGGSNEKAETPESTADSTVVKDTSAIEEAPVKSLTEAEAKKAIKAFLKKNRNKYAGSVEDIKLIGGNYTKDGALDYFYTVFLYEGGDYIYPTHFFYDSDLETIRELSLGKGPETFQHVVVKKITEGKLIGSAVMWSAFSGEHSASREVKAEFTITGNKINVEPSYFPAMYSAEKKLMRELDDMQRQMMEEADAYNSGSEEM
jgi:hypothetical protein